MSRFHRWIPDAEPPEGARAAQLRLAAAIRRVNNLLQEAELPGAELDAAARAAEDLAESLARQHGAAVHWGFAEASTAGDTHAHFDRSPVIGLGNAIAPPLALDIEGDSVRGRVTFGGAYEGPPGHVHGGWIAAVFDELLGMTQSLSGSHGMTGTLTVRYRRPTPLHIPLDLRGLVDRVEGRKIFTLGTLTAGETLCAEAEGIFISVGEEAFAALAGREEAGFERR